MLFKLNIKIRAALILVIAGATISSCEKYVDAGSPTNLLTADKVYSDSAAALGAVLALYGNGNINGTSPTGPGLILNMSQLGAMSADEAYYFNNTALDPFRTNMLTGNATLSLYSVAYQVVNFANKNIEGLTASTSLSETLKTRLTGESEFWRAYAYFYLVNYFGKVALVTGTDVPANAQLPRAATADVYAQIIKDLTNAKARLLAAYPTTERARVNKWTVSALLSRVYLYQKNYAGAEAEATAVIGSGTYSLETDLNNVFLKTSNETIWQTVSITTSAGINGITQMGRFWLPSGTIPIFVLYDTLAKTFEVNDQRKTKWTQSLLYGSTNYYYPYKYKGRTVSVSGNEYNVMFRLAEQYLIRSEARVMQSRIKDAQDDLNMIRNRAGLGNTTATNEATLLTALEHERWVELFTEMGDRWFNLRRTGRLDIAMKAKGAQWQSFNALYPIPTSELLANPALLPNNEGY